MMRRRLEKNVCVGLLSVALASSLLGCNTSDPVSLGSVYVKSAEIRASEGGTIEITKDDHAELAGTRIVIPKNALDRDTRVTIGLETNDIVDNESDPAGPVVEFGPAGTRFSAKVTLRIPYDGSLDTELGRVAILEGDATTKFVMPTALTHDASAATVSFESSGFSRFQGRRAKSACANGRCCTEQECGPALGMPNWPCVGGGTGGPTGRCIRLGETCAWEVNMCDRTGGQDPCANRTCPAGTGCDPSNGECRPSRCEDGACPSSDCASTDCTDPRPLTPNYICTDGTLAGPVCTRADPMSRECAWRIVDCD